MSRHWHILLTFALVLLCAAGCAIAPADRVEIPRAPAWQEPANAAPVESSTVIIEARRIAPGAVVSAADTLYIPLSHQWLECYVSWTWQVAESMGVVYVPESGDCDDFTNLFADVVALKAQQAKRRASPLVAKLTVTAPGGKRHALVGVATDRGIFVIEPQPSAGPFRIKPLAEFKERILAIEFGLFNPP